MGNTKPQLFAIRAEEPSAPDSGADGPPSGEHATDTSRDLGPPREEEAVRPQDKETQPAPREDEPGLMRKVTEGGSGVTDAQHRDGRPRWQLAKMTEQEWNRALESNDRQLAAAQPGSPDFARLMGVRHQLAFPPPKGVKYEDISRYQAATVKRELEASLPKPARPPLLWWVAVLLGIGALVAMIAFIVPDLMGGAEPRKEAAPTALGATATPPVAPPAPSPEPDAVATAAEVVPAPSASAAAAKTSPAVGGGAKLALPTAVRTAQPVAPATVTPTSTPTPSENTPFFERKQKTP